MADICWVTSGIKFRFAYLTSLSSGGQQYVWPAGLYDESIHKWPLIDYFLSNICFTFSLKIVSVRLTCIGWVFNTFTRISLFQNENFQDDNTSSSSHQTSSGCSPVLPLLPDVHATNRMWWEAGLTQGIWLSTTLRGLLPFCALPIFQFYVAFLWSVWDSVGADRGVKWGGPIALWPTYFFFFSSLTFLRVQFTASDKSL